VGAIDKVDKKEGRGQAELHNESTNVADTTVDSMGANLIDQTHQAKRELLKPYMNTKARDGYGIAIVSILTAFLVRWSLDSYLNDALPHATFLIAVAITSWYGGMGPSLLAIVLGGAISNWFFVQPRYQFALTGLLDQVGMVLYLAVGFATIGFIQTLRWAWQKTEEMAKDLQSKIANINLTEKQPSHVGPTASKPVSQREP